MFLNHYFHDNNDDDGSVAGNGVDVDVDDDDFYTRKVLCFFLKRAHV